MKFAFSPSSMFSMFITPTVIVIVSAIIQTAYVSATSVVPAAPAPAIPPALVPALHLPSPHSASSNSAAAAMKFPLGGQQIQPRFYETDEEWERHAVEYERQWLAEHAPHLSEEAAKHDGAQSENAVQPPSLGRKVLQQANTYRINLWNLCHEKVWVGVYSGAQKYRDQPKRWGWGGFDAIARGESQFFDVPNDIKDLEVWPRTGCQADGTLCKTGGCTPWYQNRHDHIHCNGTQGEKPKTQVRFDLGAPTGDTYNVNNAINGWNLPVRVAASNPKCPVLHDTRNDKNIAITETCQNRGQGHVDYYVTYCPVD